MVRMSALQSAACGPLPRCVFLGRHVAFLIFRFSSIKWGKYCLSLKNDIRLKRDDACNALNSVSNRYAVSSCHQYFCCSIWSVCLGNNVKLSMHAVKFMNFITDIFFASQKLDWVLSTFFSNCNCVSYFWASLKWNLQIQGRWAD